MKKLLMLSASIFEIPLIQKAQEQGYYVITTGNNAKAPGHRVSDEYAPFDYSDYDGMVELAERHSIDAISQGCSDNCALVAAYMGEKLHMKGHDTFENARIIHRKDDFKRFAKRIDLKTPIAVDFCNKNDAKAYDFQDRYPLILKPSDQAGGNGVSVVYSQEDYLKAVDKAFEMSRDGKIVVEPFIEGTVHSFSTFLINQKVVSYATLNDYSYANKYMTNTGVSPADNHANAVMKLIPEVEKVARELHLVDGLLHMQYIDSGGDYWIVEMMRRMPGNNCTTAAARAFGIDWRDWIIRAEAGLDCSGIPSPRNPEKIYGYHAVMSDHNGIYQKTEIDDEIKPYIIDFEEYDESGTVVDDYLHQKFGLVQFYFNSEEEKSKVIHRIDELIKCVVSEK